MMLYLFRHGLALDREEAAKKQVEDSLRPLQIKGKEKTKEMARTLKEIDPEISMVISSPFLRAIETADIICEVFKIKEIHQSMDLLPSAVPQVFSAWLKKEVKNHSKVIAVGHDPHLGLLTSWLLAGSTISFTEIKKSGVVALSLENLADAGPKSAILKWMLSPKTLN
jgi:phosphohistidine phosphatase